MVTISYITQKLLNDSVILREAISKEIVNYTMLGKHIKSDVEKSYGKKVKLSAITRAIERYSKKLQEKEKIFNYYYFKGIKLNSNVSYIVIQESLDILDKLQKIYHKKDMADLDIFNVQQGRHEIAIITTKECEEKLLSILEDEKISHIVDDHVIISLTYSKDYSFTPGVLYNVSRRLAWKNINILSWLHTPTELSLLIHERDVTKCYNILQEMLKNHNESELNKQILQV